MVFKKSFAGKMDFRRVKRFRPEDQELRRKSRSNRGPLTTVKVKEEYCPISNNLIESGNPRRRIFLVHGRQVPFCKQAFKEYCFKVGWEMPKISKNGQPFDIESWLADKARETFGTVEFASVTEFADMIGLRTNYFQLAKQKFCTDKKRSFNAIGFKKPGEKYFEFHGLI